MRRRPPRSTRFPYTTLFRSFRANLFNQRGAVGAVFRAIPYEIKSFDELGLPPVVSQLCERPRGLILVTRPTDRKSTRLNSTHANNSYAVFCLRQTTATLACK